MNLVEPMVSQQILKTDRLIATIFLCGTAEE
jgi:hypothetical protein